MLLVDLHELHQSVFQLPLYVSILLLDGLIEETKQTLNVEHCRAHTLHDLVVVDDAGQRFGSFDHEEDQLGCR